MPELIPHFGGPGPIVREAAALLARPELCEAQRARLRAICGQFAGRHAAVGAADAIERVAGLSRASDPPAAPVHAPV